MDKQDRPNFLFIMADQLRRDYLHCNGAEWMETPNIDKLAARGTVFNHCYTNSPVCAPARISLASGLRPHRVGSLDNCSFLPAGVTTCYQRLRDNEYYVGCVGKLDLAKPDSYNGSGNRPCCYTFGFTHPVECEGKYHAGSRPVPFGPYTQFLEKKGLLQAFHEDYKNREFEICHDSVLPADAFEDAFIGQRSARWLKEMPQDYPFHLFVSFVGPHDPFDPPTKYADIYRERELPDRILDEGTGKPQRILKRMSRIESHSEEHLKKLRRQYCASITAIDDAIGDILTALEERGDADRTIIVLTADHGEMLADHGLPIKHVAYDPSWGVPLIVTGPGLPEGKRSDAMIELMDVGETVCDIAGLNTPSHLDARSFLPVLKGTKDKHREYVLTQELPYRAIRTERWKYIETHNDMCELYDMLEDPKELCNIAESHGDLVQELRRTMVCGFSEEKWRRG